MKNIILTIALVLISLGVNAQTYYKFEVDTVQFFQMVKEKSVKENLDSNLVKYQGFEYGRVDTWEIDLLNKTVSFGFGENKITRHEKDENTLMIEYLDSKTFEKYFLILSFDKKMNRKYVLYLKDENYGGGLSYLK
jgi:uncharacterized protein YxeA